MNNQDSLIREARILYSDIGLDTFPLAPNSKQPINGTNQWQYREPDDLWKYAREGSNIAVRCGGLRNLVVIDCDEKNSIGTFNNIQALFLENGYNPTQFPTIKTASGNGRHIYATLPISFDASYLHIDKSIGSGEIRIGNRVYVVAPPSIADGNLYQLLEGCFDYIPEINPEFLFGKIAKVAIPRTQKELTTKAYRLFTTPFKPGEYKTRSEAEESIIESLFSVGFSPSEIWEEFMKYPYPGRFREEFNTSPDHARRYFQQSFMKAESWVVKKRQEAWALGNNLINCIFSSPWNGRTNTTDKIVLVALSKIVLDFGANAFNASCRRVAELAGINKDTAGLSLKRLVNKKWIIETEKEDYYGSKSYKVNFELLELINTSNQVALPVNTCIDLVHHDVFRHGVLNKSGYIIYCYLYDNPKTVEELIELTGFRKKTIENALFNMSFIVNKLTGEIQEIVYEKDEKWFVGNDCNLDFMAELLGADGKGESQKRNHRYDREIYRLRFPGKIKF